MTGTGRPVALPPAASEAEVLAELRALAARNHVAVSMIGLGYYGTVTPAVIRRNVLENPAWYTAYTPYQPEISQGRLEALLNFQTMVTDLTGLPAANASHAGRGDRGRGGDDAARRAVKARAACTSSTPTPCRRPSRCSRTRAEPLGIEVRVADLDRRAAGRSSSACCCSTRARRARSATTRR